MTTNLSRSIGFIVATIVSIALAILIAPWWLVIAIACLTVAAFFWVQDHTYRTIKPRHRRQPASSIPFRLNRHPH